VNQSIRRIPILAVIVALAAAVFAPQASAAITTPVYSFAVGSAGSGNGQFNSPQGGLVFDSAGNVWVADTLNDRIQKFNSEGEYLSQFGKVGTGNGQFQNPINIAIDSAGNLWVVDASNNRIQKFNSAGTYLSQFGTEGSGNGQFKAPRSVNIATNGDIWVSDFQNHRIQKFNSKGEYLSQFGSFGTGNGQFNGPEDIDIDPAGNLWIVDQLNNRIQKFNSKGEYLSQFGSFGTGNGQFKRPRGVAVGPEGNIWVTDRENRRVQVFNSKGEYLTKFGKSGTGPGQFSGIALGHLAFDSAGNAWVGDSGNDRVQVWVRPWRIGGKTLAELGAEKATFVSSGSFTMEIPASEKTVNCTQEGSGTISGTNGLEKTITLKCKLAGSEVQCTYNPVTLSFSGTSAKVVPTTKTFYLKTPGKTCPWDENWLFAVPTSFLVEVGAEGVQVPVSTSATGSYGVWGMYYSGSASWELTGAHSGKTLGLW
jgi:DNA-binding beta-propeller fold protein YncE